MPDDTDILGLPLILPAQAQKHVTHNEALLALDAIVQLAVLDRDRSAPPATAVPGDRHIVAAPALGDWAAREGQVAVLGAEGWRFHAPRPGWRAHVLAEGQTAVFDGLSWQTPAEGEGTFARLGIGAGPDAVNRLAVASEAVLLSHAGAGVQLKLNKAAADDTASLLFQTGWSGRAEMGTAGSDGFAVKVSADGAAWATAMSVAPGGLADFPEGLTRAGSPVYSRATVVGPVSQAAGVPTGAVIERGANANGEYVRFADGTQLCWQSGLSVANVSAALGAGFGSAALSWTFPQPFLAGTAPVVSGMADAAECWLAPSGPTAASVGLRVLGLVSKAGPVTLRAMAAGRWN